MSKIFTLLLLAASASALHFGVKNNSDFYCLIFDSDMSGTVDYHDTSKNVTVAYPFKVLNTTESGMALSKRSTCIGDVKQYNMSNERMLVDFYPNGITPDLTEIQSGRWSIELVFGTEPDTTFKIIDYKLKAIFYPSIFNSSYPGNDTITFHPANGSDFEWHANESNGFTCSSNELGLTDGKLNFDHLKVLAFTNQQTDQFPTNQMFEQCKADVRTSDLVPIIVGACLAGLVIIVLVAYLIGRARAKRQGYASV